MKKFIVCAIDIRYLLNFVTADMSEKEIEKIMVQALEEESQVRDDDSDWDDEEDGYWDDEEEESQGD